MIRRRALNLLLLCLTACASQSKTATPKTFHEIMYEHFVQLDKLQKAIIGGDLEAAKAHAKFVAETEPPPALADGWAPHVQKLRDETMVVTEAPDLAQAAIGAARVAGACGSCHRAYDQSFAFGSANDAMTHMQSHQWAADRMWDAVIGNSDVAWKEAATALIDVPLVPDTDENGLPDKRSLLNEIARQVHHIGQSTQEVTDPAARTTALGEFLATCSACHSTLGVNPSDN